MIGIKDFDMPYNCYDCELHNYHECDLTSESIEDDYCWNGDSREKHCPLVEAIPKDQYEARLKADKMATFKEFRDKLSKWMFHNSESVCGNSMIDIDYLEGYMDELLYELGIYEVENGNDNN